MLPRSSLVQYGIKAILITVVPLITNPVLTHAIATAARIRRFGAWTASEGEEGQAVEIEVRR